MGELTNPRHRAWAIIRPDGVIHRSALVPGGLVIIPSEYGDTEDTALARTFCFWKSKKKLGWRAVLVDIPEVSNV